MVQLLILVDQMMIPGQHITQFEVGDQVISSLMLCLLVDDALMISIQ